MTALETTAGLGIHTQCDAELVVEPSDITFHDLNRDTVLVQVKIRNEGISRSLPTIMRVESALFGAFVPGRPLATLPVPPIEPGEFRVLSVQAIRPHPTSLGDFDKVPPARVLTALDASPEGPTPRRDVGTATFNGRRFLPPDLWEFFGREQLHWAGNINIFVWNKAVQRHVANALPIHPGRTNLAKFVVGGGTQDAYAFEFVGLAPDWKAALYDQTDQQTLVIGASDAPILEKRWVEACRGRMLVTLAVHPPSDCKEGNVQVHVTRRSCQMTAVVEFNLSPTAQGPGCYAL